MQSRGQELYEQLRHEHPVFTYADFDWEFINSRLQIRYTFLLGEKISFRPVHNFFLPGNFDIKNINNSLFRNLVFNLGMAELVSYWKASCSPRVVIRAAQPVEGQLTFWKKLYRHGLGEFFYLNGIEPDDDFISFSVEGEEVYTFQSITKPVNPQVLVPIGGGKDSVVTLELLTPAMDCVPYIMNPRPASMLTAINAGYEESSVATSERGIAPELLDLNARGYLNGHTPFSAVLAFTASLAAYLRKISLVALSNESSANEPTIPGTTINHQYSKSFEFENDFRDYMKQYVTDGIDYFSFLRPLNELQIAALFAGYPRHYSSFRSCNVGSKQNTWCGACPKCLFTFLILSPFISYVQLVDIFGKDLFRDESLLPLLDQLTGYAEEKPFECIGTIDEVNAAIQHTIDGFGGGELPPLLRHYAGQHHRIAGFDSRFAALMKSFGPHNLPASAESEILKQAIYERKDP